MYPSNTPATNRDLCHKPSSFSSFFSRCRNSRPSTVMPVILRGVALLGVDSVMAPLALRRQAWERLARDLDPARLEAMVQETDLTGVLPAAARLMAGQVRGRIVVRIG